MHRDFLGQKILAGDFLVYPGGGNRKAEYGLILLKVLALNPNGSLKVERLDPYYGKKEILRKTSTIQTLTKVTKIQPHPIMVDIFENAEKKSGLFDLVAKWVHGTAEIDWENLDLRAFV
jgi:hypothetical protein